MARVLLPEIQAFFEGEEGQGGVCGVEKQQAGKNNKKGGTSLRCSRLSLSLFSGKKPHTVPQSCFRVSEHPVLSEMV